jgi:hypothetical protein
MEDKKYSVILVHATSHALRAEKLIKKAGISCKLVPIPRHLSSDCGVCVRLKHTDWKRAVTILKEANVEIDSIYNL